LQVEPKLRRHPKEAGESQSSVPYDGPFAVQGLGDTLGWDIELPRGSAALMPSSVSSSTELEPGSTINSRECSDSLTGSEVSRSLARRRVQRPRLHVSRSLRRRSSGLSKPRRKRVGSWSAAVHSTSPNAHFVPSTTVSATADVCTAKPSHTSRPCG